jgi:hypothetical protein
MTVSRIEDAFTELLAQHDELRAIMDRCAELAAALDRGTLEPAPLLAEVARLRVAFDSHNRFEERLLGPILRSEASVEAHVVEHRDVGRRLGGSPITDELYATLARLREHIDAEDRYFERFRAGSLVASRHEA